MLLSYLSVHPNPGARKLSYCCITNSILPFTVFLEEDLEGKTEEEIEMMKLMGFATFDTTKVSGVFHSTWKLKFLPFS